MKIKTHWKKRATRLRMFD